MTKADAWRIAVSAAGRNRAFAETVLSDAEFNVMRRLLIATLEGGETAYWDLVAKEIES